MPKASIIIPVYNKERYLKETLSQVDKQQEDDLEVILIDDDSQDHSMEIIRDFTRNTRKQTKVIKNSRNMGVAYNRNLGLEESTSDYITFLDADDILDKDFMSIMLEKMKKNSGADYIYGIHVAFRERITPEKLHLLKDRFDYEEDEVIDPRLECDYIIGSNIACGGRLYKKSSIKNLRFTESCFEDYEFFLDTVAEGLKCVYTTRPIYWYRFTTEGKYQTSLSHISDSCLDYFDIYDRVVKKHPNMDELIHNAIGFRQMYLCKGYLERVLANIPMEKEDLKEFKKNYLRYLNVSYSYYDEEDFDCMNEIEKLPNDLAALRNNIKRIAMKY